MKNGEWVRIDYTNYAVEVFIENRDLPKNSCEGLEWKGYQTMAKELLECIETYPKDYIKLLPKSDPGDIEAGRFGQSVDNSSTFNLVKEADRIAEEVHRDQKYGEKPYIVHPRSVKSLLTERFGELFTDEDKKYVAAAGLLHDCIEDSEMTYRDLNRLVGGKTASIVYAVTNEHGLMPYHRISKDPLAVAVKLADRICNLENCFPPTDETIRLIRKYYNADKRFQHELRHNHLSKLDLEPMWDCYNDLILQAQNYLGSTS